MARLVDPNKLERIKAATIDIIVKNGVNGMTISEVSKLSGVSAGYLYRYYGSKEELVEDLINTEFSATKYGLKDFLDKSEDIEAFIHKFVSSLFSFVAEDISRAKLAAALMFDAQKCALQSKNEHEFKALMKQKLTALGEKTDEINPDLDGDDIILILTTITFSYVTIKTKEDIEFFKNALNADKVAKICYNAIKK